MAAMLEEHRSIMIAKFKSYGEREREREREREAYILT